MTDAHIHNGAAGSNAGIYVNAGLASGELALTNGSGSMTKNGINVPSDRAAAILSNPAGHYFNVHTALNPGGAIRGQLAGGGATVNSGTAVSVLVRPGTFITSIYVAGTKGREPSEALGQISISLLTFQQLGGICFRSSDGSKPRTLRASSTCP